MDTSPHADNRPDWQQRVIEEHEQLQGRLTRLKAYMLTPGFHDLDSSDRWLMVRQCNAMEAYEQVLASRIARFDHT